MERIISSGDMMSAYSRVVSNKGAAGVDNMPVTALKGYLQTEWPHTREELLAGNRCGKLKYRNREAAQISRSAQLRPAGELTDWET